MTQPQLPTTSAQLAETLLKLIADAGFRKVEVLHPTDGLISLGANSALIVVTEDNRRFGMEICPFPTLPWQPAETGTVRAMTTEPQPAPENPSTVQAPTDEPPVPVEPPYEPGIRMKEVERQEQILKTTPPAYPLDEHDEAEEADPDGLYTDSWNPQGPGTTA